MNNIFENAKFGDRFRTRDGRMSIFLQPYIPTYGDNYFIMAVGDSFVTHPISTEFKVYADGRNFSLKTPLGFNDEKFDIVGRWETPIDENELNKIATDFADVQFEGLVRGDDYTDMDYQRCTHNFKVGYRTATQWK